MSVQVMAWVLQHAPMALRPEDVLVAVVLAEHANAEGGEAYPSVRRMAELTHMSERSVQRCLGHLAKHGVIEVEREATRYTPNAYRFVAFRGDRSDTPYTEVQPASRGDRGVTGVTPGGVTGVTNQASRGDTPVTRTVREPSIPSHDGTLTPFALFAAICDEAGQDVRGYSGRDRGKHCAVAERLIAEGVTEADARGVVHWLLSQDWRTAPVTVFTVEKEIGAWRASGKPASAARRDRQTPANARNVRNQGGIGKLAL